jgi:hypothetical protein
MSPAEASILVLATLVAATMTGWVLMVVRCEREAQQLCPGKPRESGESPQPTPRRRPE